MLTDFQNKKFTRLFDMLDINGDKKINTSDLDLVVKRHGEASGAKPTPERLAKLTATYHAWYSGMIEMADTNRDGNVTIEEFLAFQDKIVNDDALYQQIIGSITQLTCQIIDRDGDGRNDAEDYVSFCEVFRIDVTGARARWAALDENHDGFLNVDDVTLVLRDFFKGSDPNSPATSYFGPL